MLPNTEELFYIEIDFGDKILHFRPWKGKERRLINDLKKSEDFSMEKVYDILTYGCMQEKDIHLSEKERLYVLYKLKELSVDNLFVFKYTCNHCLELNVEVVNFSDILNPKLNKFEPITIGELTFNINNINHNSYTKKILSEQNSIFDKLYYEMILSIHSIKHNDMIFDDYSIDELSFFIDNLKAKVFDELFDKYIEQKFNIAPEVKCTCNNEDCLKENIIEIDIIPDFVSEWLQ